MQFGYFTLSDNHYADNRRGANALIAANRAHIDAKIAAFVEYAWGQSGSSPD